MRYIGSKKLLLDDLLEIIKNTSSPIHKVIDIFAGTSVVSAFLKEHAYTVYSNDFLYFSYVLQKCHVELNEYPDFSRLNLDDVIGYLNNLSLDNTNFKPEQFFMYNNYSPAHSNRMYFQENNALKIDLIRLTIEKWFQNKLIDQEGYFYLICSLLEAVPFVANITGVYAAYLKFWDQRTYKSLKLEKPRIIIGNPDCKAFNQDLNELLTEDCDLLYADPPYNAREYLPNYHILETIARYDYPEIHGISGMRNYDQQKSDFCKKNKVYGAFEKLIRDSHSKYMLISYNNEGLLSTKQLSELCVEYAKPNTFNLIEKDYRRYKNKIPNNKQGLKEQFYFFERK